MTSELVRSTSEAMNPAISRATSFSAATLRLSISADALMVPSGLRSSCARPAESWPSAARRSERRTASSARWMWTLASASCSAVRRCFSDWARSSSASALARLPTMARKTMRSASWAISGGPMSHCDQSMNKKKERYEPAASSVNTSVPNTPRAVAAETTGSSSTSQ